MSSPTIDLTFAHAWTAKILPARPVILPSRHFVYPLQVEEVERGALELLITPQTGLPFLATCALGFRDPIVPTGIWSVPNPNEICAVSGGYAYVIDTAAPDRFTMLPFRPVLQVHRASEPELLLFVGHRTILAWGAHGEAWQSANLSDEGITVTSIQPNMLHGLGWNMLTDRETPFTVELRSGNLTKT